MANNYLQIGAQVLPPASRMNIIPLPQYAEWVSMNGIVGRDIRTADPEFIIALSWEAVTPTEKDAIDAAWELVITASTTNVVHYTGVDSSFYDVLPDDKSNEYNFTGYAGIKAGAGLMVLYDISMTIRATRIFV